MGPLRLLMGNLRLYRTVWVWSLSLQLFRCLKWLRVRLHLLRRVPSLLFLGAPVTRVLSLETCLLRWWTLAVEDPILLSVALRLVSPVLRLRQFIEAFPRKSMAFLLGALIFTTTPRRAAPLVLPGLMSV